jgi:hypothetical protein
MDLSKWELRNNGHLKSAGSIRPSSRLAGIARSLAARIDDRAQRCLSDGHHTTEAKAERRQVRMLIRGLRQLMDSSE